MIIQGQTGPQQSSDGNQVTPRMGRLGELVTTELHGKYYEQCARGNVYIGSTAIAGLALPIYSATAQLFMIWNPLGSLKNVSIIKVAIARVSGTGSADHLMWGGCLVAGADAAANNPITAYTKAYPINALIGAGMNSVVKFANTTATALAAPTIVAELGISNSVYDGTGATVPPFPLIVNYDGDLVIGPGAALFLCNDTAASTVWGASVTWEEVPV